MQGAAGDGMQSRRRRPPPRRPRLPYNHEAAVRHEAAAQAEAAAHAETEQLEQTDPEPSEALAAAAPRVMAPPSEPAAPEGRFPLDAPSFFGLTCR